MVGHEGRRATRRCHSEIQTHRLGPVSSVRRTAAQRPCGPAAPPHSARPAARPPGCHTTAPPRPRLHRPPRLPSPRLASPAATCKSSRRKHARALPDPGPPASPSHRQHSRAPERQSRDSRAVVPCPIALPPRPPSPRHSCAASRIPRGGGAIPRFLLASSRPPCVACVACVRAYAARVPACGDFIVTLPCASRAMRRLPWCACASLSGARPAALPPGLMLVRTSKGIRYGKGECAPRTAR